MNKALFIILNGTLITTKSGKSFPINREDWRFKTDFYELFKQAIEKQYTIVILDNQLSIGDGFLVEKYFIAKLEKICKVIEKDLDLESNSVLYNYCGNREDIFRCKPNPGMLYEVALDNEIGLRDSILIGNSNDDAQFSFIGGIETYYTLPQLPFVKL